MKTKPLSIACALLAALGLSVAPAQGETVASGVLAKAAPEIPVPDTPVLMMGDSMMALLGKAMEKAFRKAGVQPAVAFSSLGSGLVRPAAFDWTAKTAELLETHKPKTVFVALGTNDRQPIEGEEGGTILYGKPEWEAAYARRIAAIMDQLIAGGVTRVVWFRMPAMKEPVNQAHIDLVNAIVEREAAEESRKDKVSVFDLGPVLSRRPGEYTQYLMSATGEPLTVRDPDGVHLTNDGGKIIAGAVLKALWKKK